MSFLKKYRQFMPLALFPVLLILIRILYTGNFNFHFLLWNLLLAFLPAFFSHQLQQSANKHALVQYGFAGLWLLFFPNAAYIVTDLFHLYSRPPVPLWFDLLLLFSAALNGLLAGFMSLREVEQWLKAKFPKTFVQLALIVLLTASGFGIYLGRYLRWNSWDIAVHPFRLGRNIGAHILCPALHMQSWALSILFGTWMYLVYASFKKWSAL